MWQCRIASYGKICIHCILRPCLLNFEEIIKNYRLKMFKSLPYSLSGVFSYQPLTLLIRVGYLQTYISNNGKLNIKFSKCWQNQFFIQELYFRSNAFASGDPKSRKIQFPPPLTKHLANFSTVCRQKTCWEFFIYRVIVFLELINKNLEYSKCKSQEWTP